MGYTVISTFSGCGGSSLGYQMAGYKELLAIEWNNTATATFKMNFPEVPIWQKDICLITPEEILASCNLEIRELDLLDGSPPCQGFSTAGKRQVLDDRNDLFREFVRLIEGLQPKVFVMENVSGMIQGEIKGLFIKIMKALKATGYQVKCRLMNTMWYGVPQSRQRLIFIGVRKDLGIEPSYPNPSNEFIPLGKICPDVLASRSMRLNPWIPAYKSCCTITRTPYKGLFKIINGEREPDLRELMALSSFPDSFNFSLRGYEAWNMIGNSVPPLFMKAIAEYIKIEILQKAELINGKK